MGTMYRTLNDAVSADENFPPLTIGEENLIALYRLHVVSRHRWGLTVSTAETAAQPASPILREIAILPREAPDTWLTILRMSKLI